MSFIPKPKIQKAADRLLASYVSQFGSWDGPATPVGEILECVLDLSLTFTDLRSEHGFEDVLGALSVKKRKVTIDQSLDPAEHPEKEGRYHFTMAHELGHWELHRQAIETHTGQGLLFSEDGEIVLCRQGRQRDSAERQADLFASYLLMPEKTLWSEWVKLHGQSQYDASDEIAALKARYGSSRYGETPVTQISRVLADLFRVSGQAMQIRLIDLGFLLTQKPEPDLFSSADGT